ncbi:EamA family transporter [Xanthomarina sp. GH4-25]|uniref:EamA family transporter n=1 Tax=Xanthomarina sp. GH4-25 TaxID=3349335 RepID=UPI0026D3B30D
MSQPKSGVLIILSFFSFYVIWGSTFLLNKIVVLEVSPLLLASIRFLLAGGLIIIISKLLKLSLKISSQQLKTAS